MDDSMHEVEKTDDDALFIFTSTKDFINQFKVAIAEHNEMELSQPHEGCEPNLLKWKDLYWQVKDGVLDTYTGDLVWGKAVECDTGTIVMFCRDTHLEEDYQAGLRHMEYIKTIVE